MAATITLYNDQPSATTCVPNNFIDQYMTQANGEYVKIYLYLLRSISQAKCSNFSLSEIADHFDCTERDILRALKYWDKRGLLRLEYDENKNLSGICFLTETSQAAPVPKMTQHKDLTNRFIQAAVPRKHAYAPDELEHFQEKEDVRELLFVTEKYLGRTLNMTDLNILFFWYDELQFSAELIEFLIENCVAKGHTSLYYMKRIAEDYAEKGIHTVEEARQQMDQSSDVYYAVTKAFGIKGRQLGKAEMDFLTTWNNSMGFSPEMISEACDRTIRTIHEPSFGYANTILESWSKQGLSTLDDVKKADESYQKTQRSKKTRTANTASNRFINFKQRENDYDELQKKLLRNSMQ